MTTTAKIVERLRRWASVSEPGGGLVSRDVLPVCTEAADHLESLARKRDRAVEALHLSRADFGALKRLCTEQPVLNSNDVQRMATNAEARARRTLAEIDAESEGER